MAVLTDFTVVFPGNAREVLTLSLQEVAKELYNRDLPLRERPLLIINNATGQKLMYNEYEFYKFHFKAIDEIELVKSTWCDGLFRNNTILMTQHRYEVEPDSLWLLRGNELILIDRDNFVTCEFNVSEKLFYEIA